MRNLTATMVATVKMAYDDDGADRLDGFAGRTRRLVMHAVIRRYTAAPAVLVEARPKLAQLEQLMRQTPGFVAYYFLETDEGLTTITVTDDEAGATESMSRAAKWVQDNLPQTRASMSAPEVITGRVLISANK
jgi:hypothetical protein